MARELLSKKGIEYTDYDITKDREALEEMRKISGGHRRVPVISICNEVIVGFDRNRLEQALSCLEQSSEVE
jgi:glutaredoxin